MSLLASFTACCDYCETDTGDSRPTIEEALDYALRGGWVQREVGLFCEECNYNFFVKGATDES